MRSKFFDRREAEGERNGVYFCTWVPIRPKATKHSGKLTSIWNNQRIGKTISGKFLDNFLKKTIIQNELANANVFVLREEIKQILTCQTCLRRILTQMSQKTSKIPFLLRVWSWLRMNAGGVPNTCKSSEKSWNETSVKWRDGKRRTGE